jgi:hypothetical protein
MTKRDSIALIVFGFLFWIFAMAFCGCNVEHKGCQMNRGMVGYGNR